MDETRSGDALDGPAVLYRAILARLGLRHVTCAACARALLPWPLNWESYTYTARDGRSWTWDVVLARAVVTRRAARAGAVLLDPDALEAFLGQHGAVDEEHLRHIPAQRLQEPVLVAPLPDNLGHVLVDGSHRTTVLIRARLPVQGFVLTPIESALAIDVVPLTMRRIHDALRRQGLLPDDLRA
jgi:hypothetical protein